MSSNVSKNTILFYIKLKQLVLLMRWISHACGPTLDYLVSHIHPSEKCGTLQHATQLHQTTLCTIQFGFIFCWGRCHKTPPSSKYFWCIHAELFMLAKFLLSPIWVAYLFCVFPQLCLTSTIYSLQNQDTPPHSKANDCRLFDPLSVVTVLIGLFHDHESL